MMNHADLPVADRLLDSLPAVYREADRGPGRGDLQALLAAFEGVLLGRPGSPIPEGYEQCIEALPGLLAQHPGPGGFDAATRDAFAPWLASRWVAFAPFAHFGPERLRRIVAGIVPLYGRRGTKAYLVELLGLCFDELAEVLVHEHLSGGLLVGESRIGHGSLLGTARAFSFTVEVRLHPREGGWSARALAALEAALRAVIDFAKPAHTSGELLLATLGGDAPRVHDDQRSHS